MAQEQNAPVEAVRIDALAKRYSRNAAFAVENVSFSCYTGEIVGVLGHNGAGKSTVLKCVEGMLPFEKGTISIFGHDVASDGMAAKALTGFVTDNQGVFVRMTGLQYLNFMADVYKVPTDVRKERLEALEAVFRLGNAVGDLIASYSHGMRQKISMMGSLIHEPKLWILDEPMMGLDPLTMHAVQVFMRGYADRGHCILFSSHLLNTVARLCDRVVLLRAGAQVSELDVRKMTADDPQFDFETYFLEQARAGGGDGRARS